MSNDNKKGRKAKETDYNNIFAFRLRELIKATGKKQQEIADNIGVSRQAINKWVNGETIPDIFSAAKIADLFNVSTDYLTGRTGTKSVNPEIQAACEVTGLSEDAVRNLIKAQKIKSSFFNPADEFIKCSDFDMFVLNIYQYIMSILCTEEEYNDVPNKMTMIIRFMESNQLSSRDLEVMGIKFRKNNRISLSIESEINNQIRDFLDKLTEKILKNNPDLHDMRYYGIEKEE